MLCFIANSDQTPSTALTQALKTYQNTVQLLLDSESYPGLSREELETFKTTYRTEAYTCRYSRCPRASNGFKSDQLRCQHENDVHRQSLKCTVPECKFGLSFASNRALKSHIQKYHSLPSTKNYPQSIRRLPPPSPPQIEQITRNGGRMPNGTAWPGGPPQMMPSQGQQQGPMGTSQQWNAMPPPPAPPTGGEPGRTNPSSPQQSAAPPTPSQVSKANPRGKKDSKETKKVSLVLHIYLIIVDIHYRSLQRRIRQLQVRLQPQKQNTLQLPRLRRQSRRCILLLSINSRMGQDSNLTCNHKLQLRLPHLRCSRPQLIPTEHPLEISLKM